MIHIKNNIEALFLVKESGEEILLPLLQLGVTCCNLNLHCFAKLYCCFDKQHCEASKQNCATSKLQCITLRKGAVGVWKGGWLESAYTSFLAFLGWKSAYQKYLSSKSAYTTASLTIKSQHTTKIECEKSAYQKNLNPKPAYIPRRSKGVYNFTEAWVGLSNLSFMNNV